MSEGPSKLPKILSAGVLACATALPFYPFLFPQRGTPATASAARPAAAPSSRVVVLILDGVGARVAFEPGSMPLLQARLPSAARGTGLASFPTLTPPGLRAVMSGHRSLPEAEIPGGHRRQEPDSVPRRAAAAGLKAFIVGQQDWPPLFGDQGVSMDVVNYQGPGPDYDAGIHAAAREIVSGRRGPWDLAVVHYFSLDPLAHLIGTEAQDYRNRLKLLDRRIDELVALAGPRTTFVLTADHGQSKTGAHGGTSPTSTQVPIVIWGERARPSSIGEVAQVDIAPTIAALLGTPPPAQSEGEPLLQALRLSPQERASALLDSLEQREARIKSTRADWTWLTADVSGPLAAARRMAAAGQWSEASKAAERGIKAADDALREASPVRWYGRFIAAQALLVVACGLAFLWRRHGSERQAAAGILMAVTAAAVAAPCLWPSLWPRASVACLLAALLALALVMFEISASPPAPALELLAGTGLLWLAAPSLIDVPLWSWIILLAAWVSRRPRLGEGVSARWLIAGACLAAGALMGPKEPPDVSSVLRIALPDFSLHVGKTAVNVLSAAGVACLFAAFWSTLGKRPLRLSLSAAAIVPLAAALILGGYARGTASTFVCWALIAASLTQMSSVSILKESRGLWLAIAALAFHETLSGPPRTMRLMTGALLGWSLPSDESRSPSWAAMELVALLVWGYTLGGYHLDFSQLTVGGAYEALGTDWHPLLLAAVVVLRQVCAITAAVLPSLPRRPRIQALAALPLFGAISSGNLLELWINRFWGGGGVPASLTEESVARALCAAILAWVMALWWLGAWAWRPRAVVSPARRLEPAS